MMDIARDETPVVEAGPLRILMIEDDGNDAALVKRALERGGMEVDVAVVDHRDAFLQAMETFAPQAILADFNLPGWTGIEALREVRASGLDIPFLLVTGTQTDEVAADCMREGADDYLLKRGLMRLPNALRNALARREAVRQREGAERRLQHLQEQHRLIAEHTGDLICLLDAEGRYLYASPSYQTVLGFVPEDLLGQAVLDRVTPEEQKRLHGRLNGAIPGETLRYETRVRHSDGTWRDIEGTARRVRGIEGGRDTMVLVSRDVSERMRFARAVEEAAREWRATFDAIGDAVALTTLDQRVLRGNRAAADLAGVAPEGMIGRTLCDMLHCPLAAEMCPSHRMLVTHQRETETIRLGDRWFLIAVDPRVDPEGNVIGGIHILTDVTREKTDGIRLQESFDRLRRAMGGVIRSMGRTVESRDPYTAGHQQRVARLARSIAVELGLDEDTLTGVYTAAEIHDIGKIAVPSEILVRPGRLSSIEFDLIKSHVVVGYDILQGIEFPWPIADMVRQHHERQDGTGYPDGLKGDDILLGSRILAVADVVEAMASHRPYRAALGIDQAIQEIVAGRGSRYDGTVVDACLVVLKDPRALDGE
jgi:PAS domain S-box-containing protein/putative nucleotidyltransferase with HDIG domain